MTASADQLPLDLPRAPGLSRADWVEGAANAEAGRRLDDWRRWPGGALALIGPAGVGKSHRAGVWAQEAGAARLSAATPSRDFPSTGAPVWVDDADGAADDETLFHLLNRAAHGDGALLLTARTAPADWTAALPDLRSRLNALAVVELTEPDEALLTALLSKFFRERFAKPTPELLRYLVYRMPHSAEAAREVVERLMDAGGRLGISLARQLLGDEQAPLFDDDDEGASAIATTAAPRDTHR